MCYTVPVKNIYQKNYEKIYKKSQSVSRALYTLHNVLHLQLGTDYQYRNKQRSQALGREFLSLESNEL